METPVNNTADDKTKSARERRTSRCSATTKKGERCSAPCVRGRRLCGFHVVARDSDAMKLRAAHARQALAAKVAEREELKKINKCKPLTSVAEAKALLGVLVSEMRNNKAPAKDIAAVVGAYLNAHTLQRDESTIAKIDAIHEQMRQMKITAQRSVGITGEWPAEREAKEDAELEN